MKQVDAVQHPTNLVYDPEVSATLGGKHGLCAYCGEPATQIEHVVAAAILLDKATAVKVPACAKCNTAKSKDDEYLLAVLTLSNETYRLPELLDKRAAMERAALREEFISPARKLLLTFAYRSVEIGGKEYTVSTVHADGDRINRALAWIVRGLYFHHRKMRLDASCTFRSYGALGSDNKVEFEKFWPLIKDGPYKVGEALIYKVSDYRAIDAQMWCFVFYDRMFMRVVVNEEKVFAEFDRMDDEKTSV